METLPLESMQQVLALVFMDWYRQTLLQGLKLPFFFLFSMTRLLSPITLCSGEDFLLVKTTLVVTSIGQKTLCITAMTL
jgi:hypothetical protein